MKYNLAEVHNLPDTFSLQDLCRVCHVSKRDGRYYLQSELIPCIYTGKKTRCYKISKSDLLKVLKDYEEYPPKIRCSTRMAREWCVLSKTVTTRHLLAATRCFIGNRKRVLSKEAWRSTRLALCRASYDDNRIHATNDYAVVRSKKRVPLDTQSSCLDTQRGIISIFDIGHL